MHFVADLFRAYQERQQRLRSTVYRRATGDTQGRRWALGPAVIVCLVTSANEASITKVNPAVDVPRRQRLATRSVPGAAERAALGHVRRGPRLPGCERRWR